MNTLTWKIDKTIPKACPDYKADPYTGEWPSVHCLVYHFETITENRTADFETKKEALDFAGKAPYSCYDFKLNGKEIKDKREKRESPSIFTSTGGTLTITDGATTTLNL